MITFEIMLIISDIMYGFMKELDNSNKIVVRAGEYSSHSYIHDDYSI